MKVLQTEHKGILYSFEYMEQSDKVIVVKDDKPTYEIKMHWSADEQFVCNCPGSVWRGKCWHIEMIPQLIAMPSITEPWADWAEEAANDKAH